MDRSESFPSEHYRSVPSTGLVALDVVLPGGRRDTRKRFCYRVPYFILAHRSSLGVGTCLRLLGIEAIYPKKRTTWPGAGHKITPYLLRNVAVIRPDQV